MDDRTERYSHLPPSQARAFLGLIRAGEKLDRRLGEQLERRHGLGLRAFEVLLFLAEFSPDGSKRMTDLTAQAPLSQSRVSRLVADLERWGWVERAPAEDDGRGVLVSITEEGRKKFREAQATHLEDLDRLFFHKLDRTELRQLGEIAAKLLAES